MSNDGRNGLTIIGFVGSVFSPYYFRARQKMRGDPENFCAINVALYGEKRRWAMTERGRVSVSRSADHFAVGPSHMEWTGNVLTVSIRERCVPMPFPLKGTVSIHFHSFFDEFFGLDGAGMHWWQVVDPITSIEVRLEQPALNWQGRAYIDTNWGERPLEHDFKYWTWQRSAGTKNAAVYYNATHRNGTVHTISRAFSTGTVTQAARPEYHFLPAGFWGMSRAVASEGPPTLVATLEDAPFYTRNHVRVRYDGEWQDAFHESLSLERFANPLVQRMLPFRMPRRQ